jgi:hypothetical protein
MQCQGPCLEHCYHKNTLNYFTYGLIIGLLFSIIINHIYKNKNKDKENIDK